MRRHSGMISVVRRKLITSCSSVFTKAPTVSTKKRAWSWEKFSFFLFKLTLIYQKKKKKKNKRKFTNDSKAGKSQVLKWTCFAHSVQKWIEEQRDVGSKECRSGRQNKINLQSGEADVCTNVVMYLQQDSLHKHRSSSFNMTEFHGTRPCFAFLTILLKWHNN